MKGLPPECGTAASGRRGCRGVPFPDRKSVTEKLKKHNQMEWIRAGNSIYHCAEEIVLNEIIYV